MNLSDFIHPEDSRALQTLQAIPVFPKLLKFLLENGLEDIMWCDNVATNIRLSDTQMPEVYHHLTKLCDVFNIPVPELYLTLDPSANAWTSGNKRIYIVVTLGLIKKFKDEELDVILAHECGHIICNHVLYNMVAQTLLAGTEQVVSQTLAQIPGGASLGSIAMHPIRQALLAWERASELSADRVATMYSSSMTVAKVMAKLDGVPKYIVDNMDLISYSNQGREFQTMKDSGVWKKALRYLANNELDHPYAPVRAFEAMEWENSEKGKIVCKHIKAITSGNICPNCKAPIEDDWTFCKNCGTKLK